MDALLEEVIACPRDRTALSRAGDELVCNRGHRYPIYDEIPVLLLDDVRQTAWWAAESIKKGRTASPERETAVESKGGIDPHVQGIVAATSGYLYKPLVNQLTSYPIPDLRLPESRSGDLLLDIGCNWGRWSIAAARKGYRVIGIDPALDAVLAARRVARQLGVRCSFAVADARYLPFRAQAFDFAFSYSVIQHFSKGDAKAALVSIGFVLRRGGTCLVQMPNKFGIRSFYHFAKRKFSEGKAFDVRYYTVRELENLFRSVFGNAKTTVDGYFGLGIQPSDIDLLPPKYRAVVHASEWLRAGSKRVPGMRYVADSIYVESRLDR